jgi:hypothetical protein
MRKTKTKFYPLSKYKKPPQPAPKGYEWLKVRKSVRFQFRRPVYETAYAEVYVRPTRRRKGRYEIKKYRLLAGYKKTIGRTHVKGWIKQRIAEPPAAENWVSIQQFLIGVQTSLRRKYHLPFEYKTHVYTDKRGRFFRYLETNTLFNYYKKEILPDKKYVVAIVYYIVKRKGYEEKDDVMQFEKMSFGNFPRPMNVYETAQYVKNYLIPLVKEYLAKQKYFTFERYMYFGAMAENELRYEKGATAGRFPSKKKQREREKTEKRFVMNPKGMK